MPHIIHIPQSFQKMDNLLVSLQSFGTIQRTKNSIIVHDADIQKVQSVVDCFTSDGVILLSDAPYTIQSFAGERIILQPHGLTPPSSPLYFYSSEVASIYRLQPRLTGPRVNIAVISLGGGYKMSDMTTYWDAMKLSVRPNLYDVSIGGAKNTPGQAADAENVLDIQVISGICPNSNIYVHFAPNSVQGFYAAIQAAVFNTTTPFSTISISWGMTEKYWGVNNLRAFDDLFKTAVSRGITVCVASGDNGASDGTTGLNVNFPASSPNVLACGGTNLVCPNKTYDKKTIETVWQNVANNGSTGGGFSTVFGRPAYQNQAITNTMRGTPDVAGVADPRSGWIIYLNGRYQVMGGTSAVAPMWAAFLANMGRRVFINPFIYSQTPNLFYDVVSGNNGGYSAVRGWDATTGWGSPNGIIWLNQMKNIR